MATEMIRYFDLADNVATATESTEARSDRLAGAESASAGGFQILRLSSIADPTTLMAVAQVNAGIGVTMCESAEEFFAQLDSDDDA